MAEIPLPLGEAQWEWRIHYHVGTKTFVLRKLSANKGADTFVQAFPKGVKKLYTVTYKRDHDHFSSYKQGKKAISKAQYEALFKKVHVTCKAGKISNASKKTLCTFKKQIKAHEVIYPLAKS